MSKRTHAPVGESVKWLTCQIDGIADYATRPSSALTVEELSSILTSLKQAEMSIGKAFCHRLSDGGRAA